MQILAQALQITLSESSLSPSSTYLRQMDHEDFFVALKLTVVHIVALQGERKESSPFLEDRNMYPLVKLGVEIDQRN